MAKSKIHISMPGPISDALTALAKLEGRSISDILEEQARVALQQRGFLPVVSAEQIAAEIASLKNSKRKK